MRLHSLRVSAFGPFAGTVEVDFDEVSSAGLFLIQGPTGAGKTSLLDAVAYALYAGLPGARRGSRQLRSDHAPPHVVPQVRLDFTTGRRRFRVTRSPEFARPKKRGDGMTRSPATVLLEEDVAGSWVVRSTRADEVGEIVTEVLGMGLEQFSKVVLLPQGEFAAFLRADAEERRTLLERLFDISTWSGVEDWLVEQRRLGGAQLEAARAEVETDLARLRDVVATLPDRVVADLDLSAASLNRPDGFPADLEALVARCVTHVDETLAALDLAERRTTAAQAGRLEAQAVADRQRRGALATAALAELDRRADGLVAVTSRVRRAERAALVAPHLTACDRSQARTRGAQDTVDRLRLRLSLAEDASTRPQVESLAEEVASRTASLTETRRLAHEAEATQARLERERVDVTAVAAELATARGHAATLEANRSRAEQAVVGHEQEERRRVALRLRHEVVGELVWLADGLEKAQTAKARLTNEHRDARDTEQGARDSYLTLRQARLDGMAAELAARLVDGEPCIVCGADTHPAPAAASGGTVTAAQVTAAEDTWQERRRRREAVGEKLAAATSLAETRTDDLTRQVAGAAGGPEDEQARAVDVPAWRGELREIEQTLRDMGDGARAETAVRDALVSATEAIEQHGLRLGLVGERLAAGQAVVQELEASLGGVRDQARDALSDHEDCPCRRLVDASDEPVEPADAVDASGLLRHHEMVSTLLSDLARSLLVVEDAELELGEARRRLEEALQTEEFASPADAAAALLSDGEVAVLRLQLQEAEATRAAATSTLGDPAVTAALELPPADEPAAVAALNDARQAHSAARQDEVVARHASQQLVTVVGSLVSRLAALSPLRERAELVAGLADCVTGVGADNALRMRLSSFVLAARLEKVAALANERLAVMGDGRYQLQHSDGLASGRRRSGLGLVVRDLWTGIVRDTATLSGGESFMASLALALGLADAVREEAGGFDLQTLFVDEGFGTLDDESLEQVLGVLDGLREGGRSVGVVSHVGDLLARIPTQICVTKTQTGSTVALRTGGPRAA